MREPAVVTDLGRAGDERLLLGDAAPLARQQPAPHLVRIPRQSCAHRGERTVRIGEHPAGRHAKQPLLGREQPVEHRKLARRVDAELLEQPLVQARHRDPGAGLDPGPPEAHRHAVERLGQVEFGDAVIGEDEHPRSPPVIGRALRVVTEDVRAPAEQRGAVRHADQLRCDDLDVEPLRQAQAAAADHVPTVRGASTTFSFMSAPTGPAHGRTLVLAGGGAGASPDSSDSSTGSRARRRPGRRRHADRNVGGRCGRRAIRDRSTRRGSAHATGRAHDRAVGAVRHDGVLRDDGTRRRAGHEPPRRSTPCWRAVPSPASGRTGRRDRPESARSIDAAGRVRRCAREAARCAGEIERFWN